MSPKMAQVEEKLKAMGIELPDPEQRVTLQQQEARLASLLDVRKALQEEVESLRREGVARRTTATVLSDDALLRERPEPLGQDVGRDPLFRGGELRVRALRLEHEIAHDQEAPRVPNDLERVVGGAI